MLHDPREGLDGEDRAAAELNRRARRLRAFVAVPFILLGLPAAYLGFLLMAVLQILASGVELVLISVLLGSVPAAGACLALGMKLGHRAVQFRCRTWFDEIAREHGVPRSFLEEVASVWTFDPKAVERDAQSFQASSEQIAALTSLNLSVGLRETPRRRRRRPRRKA